MSPIHLAETVEDEKDLLWLTASDNLSPSWQRSHGEGPGDTNMWQRLPNITWNREQEQEQKMGALGLDLKRLASHNDFPLLASP